ncbi:hypothetical protein Pyn_25390 [Prunus yedoensis var. nudiflora]|uniref:Uncharacterized protein n=1 Tax=Prunus yedoensis var. nudiflora TaxID=2094558 RepID=A0A314YHW0_PRUYE|nr:hypothetical protein Pyn_25390 [Prunus yedoensis var. nudiflora]
MGICPRLSQVPSTTLPLPTSSASEGDSDDPALEINDMKNKLEHDSSLVHYWTQKCVGAEQKLAYLTRQVNKARYRKEKHRIRGQRRKLKAEDLQMTLEDANVRIFEHPQRRRQAWAGNVCGFQRRF